MLSLKPLRTEASEVQPWEILRKVVYIPEKRMTSLSPIPGVLPDKISTFFVFRETA